MGLFACTSQPALIGASSEPSSLTALYSVSIFAKRRLTCSSGASPVGTLLAVWYDPTVTSVSVHLRNSTGLPPERRTVRIAFLICSPLAQARNNFGEALLTLIVK